MADPSVVLDAPGELVVRDVTIDPTKFMMEGVNDLVQCSKCKGKTTVPRTKNITDVLDVKTCPNCEGKGTEYRPVYTVGEIGKVFFHRSGHWVRWREGQGAFVLDGEGSGMRTKHGARFYRLIDIEHMAHALASSNLIDARDLLLVLNVVRAQAMLYGYVL